MLRTLLVLGTFADMAAEAEKEGSAKSLVPKYVEFKEKGTSVIGRYLTVRSLRGTNEGTYNQYTFETDDGMVEFHCGAHFDGHAGALMKFGGIYKLTFNGKEQIEGSKNVVNKFDCVELAYPKG